jgi:hypothetical protein
VGGRKGCHLEKWKAVRCTAMRVCRLDLGGGRGVTHRHGGEDDEEGQHAVVLTQERSGRESSVVSGGLWFGYRVTEVGGGALLSWSGNYPV